MVALDVKMNVYKAKDTFFACHTPLLISLLAFWRLRRAVRSSLGAVPRQHSRGKSAKRQLHSSQRDFPPSSLSLGIDHLLHYSAADAPCVRHSHRKLLRYTAWSEEMRTDSKLAPIVVSERFVVVAATKETQQLCGIRVDLLIRQTLVRHRFPFCNGSNGLLKQTREGLAFADKHRNISLYFFAEIQKQSYIQKLVQDSLEMIDGLCAGALLRCCFQITNTKPTTNSTSSKPFWRGGSNFAQLCRTVPATHASPTLSIATLPQSLDRKHLRRRSHEEQHSCLPPTVPRV
jgi:hypothetical protein